MLAGEVSVDLHVLTNEMNPFKQYRNEHLSAFLVVCLRSSLLGPLLKPRREASSTKGPVTLCRCETSCWRIAQCNMGCLAIILFREAPVARSRTQLYFSQRIAAIDNTIAQCITPPATCLAILRQF